MRKRGHVSDFSQNSMTRPRSAYDIQQRKRRSEERRRVFQAKKRAQADILPGHILAPQYLPQGTTPSGPQVIYHPTPRGLLIAPTLTEEEFHHRFDQLLQKAAVGKSSLPTPGVTEVSQNPTSTGTPPTTGVPRIIRVETLAVPLVLPHSPVAGPHVPPPRVGTPIVIDDDVLEIFPRSPIPRSPSPEPAQLSQCTISAKESVPVGDLANWERTIPSLLELPYIRPVPRPVLANHTRRYHHHQVKRLNGYVSQHNKRR
ncbi:uncharacterized protein LOC127285725 [Leptopilina boulardi]|uniref:uncharacterized protein LOC127285725 n=1 Tax=Leptopilina boulardi TaxID=63433 RepID=UPI0021F6577E|nr:uncharacterized protein LOC127285725 [Leptopilina boulardi]